jgi:uncharacterized membrane protein
MRRSWVHVTEAGRQQWLCRPNCALRPGQLAAVFGAVAAMSLVVAGAFAWSGAWMVLPFACLEVLALGLAFAIHARHVLDYEQIVLGPDGLEVETRVGASVHQHRCTPAWLRVEYAGRRRELIGLVASGKTIEVGRFVPESQRSELAAELKTHIQGIRW